MALAAGLAVANLYYHQPLLGDIGRTFQASDRAVGLVATVSQVGYALGLLLIVPLGDSLERRRVIVIMTLLVSLALMGVALAPNLSTLVIASGLVGVTTVVPQLLVPVAAHLAAPEQRGRVVGQVMSGLLIGILLSRTAAGFVGVQFGWRSMFWFAAGLMLVLAGVLRLTLPHQPASASWSYPALLRSLVALVREEPVLRLHSLLGALTFGAFSAFWSTLALHLHALPQHYGARVAGLFGVVGVAGAIASWAACCHSWACWCSGPPLHRVRWSSPGRRAWSETPGPPWTPAQRDVPPWSCPEFVAPPLPMSLPSVPVPVVPPIWSEPVEPAPLPPVPPLVLLPSVSLPVTPCALSAGFGRLSWPMAPPLAPEPPVAPAPSCWEPPAVESVFMPEPPAPCPCGAGALF